MKRLLTSCAVAMLLPLGSSALAATIQIDVNPSQVPDETQPRVNVGDAPAGYGPDSWQGPVAGVGNKTNWHARYLADGDALSDLFPADAATMTIADLAEINYSTKRPTGTAAGSDWWIQIYTRPTGSGDNASWYHDRFINNYSAHTNIGAWTQYSTLGAMTFQSNGLGVIGVSTLAQLIADAGSQEIEMISIQTNSGWNGFDGYIDGLEIELTNGNIGQVNLVPEPASLALLGLGGLTVFARGGKRHA
jgi:PEP-CTERM motif